MHSLNGLTIQLPIIGEVTEENLSQRSFKVKTRGGAIFEVLIKAATWFDTVTNLDRLNRERLPLDLYSKPEIAGNSPGPLESNINIGDLIAVEGVQYIYNNALRYEAMTVHLLKSHKGYYLFEHTVWWKTQVEAMANKWLDALFGDKRTYSAQRALLDIAHESVRWSRWLSLVPTATRLALLIGTQLAAIAQKRDMRQQTGLPTASNSKPEMLDRDMYSRIGSKAVESRDRSDRFSFIWVG
jgi:hypothetical protein